MQILHHLFISYGAIDIIDLKENAVNMIGPYDSAEPPALLIDQLEKGREFERTRGKMIANAMLVLKGSNLLAQTAILNKDIWEWCRQSTELNTQASFKTFFHRAH